MAEAAVNGGSSTLAADITSGATTITIQAGDVGKFPATGTYRIALSDGGHTEIATVTGGQGTAALTVTRASEPFAGVQTPFAFLAATPTTIEPVLTIAGLLQIIQQGRGGNLARTLALMGV